MWISINTLYLTIFMFFFHNHRNYNVPNKNMNFEQHICYYSVISDEVLILLLICQYKIKTGS